MTTEKRKTTIEWLKEEIRSLRLAPKINGCGPDNWADLLEIMETCLEAVRSFKVDETSKYGIDRDSWETCSECEKKNCDNCYYGDYLARMEPCNSCEGADHWKPIQNFCGECGRPLAEEAWAMLEKRLKWERK